jgi:hypothetical protein
MGSPRCSWLSSTRSVRSEPKQLQCQSQRPSARISATSSSRARARASTGTSATVCLHQLERQPRSSVKHRRLPSNSSVYPSSDIVCSPAPAPLRCRAHCPPGTAAALQANSFPRAHTGHQTHHAHMPNPTMIRPHARRESRRMSYVVCRMSYTSQTSHTSHFQGRCAKCPPRS